MKTIKQEYDPAIPLEKLVEHPDNPNRGDEKVVKESINANGFYGVLLIQKSTGRIIGGHTRYRVALKEGAKTIPGMWLDIDDKQALKILLADNRTRDLAYYDDPTLLQTLSKIVEDDGKLLGTGYDDATYRILLQSTQKDELYVGNVRQGMTPLDRQPLFEGSDIRSVILPYSKDDYDDVIMSLAEIRQKMGLDTNAEAVQALIKDYLAK